MTTTHDTESRPFDSAKLREPLIAFITGWAALENLPVHHIAGVMANLAEQFRVSQLKAEIKALAPWASALRLKLATIENDDGTVMNEILAIDLAVSQRLVRSMSPEYFERDGFLEALSNEYLESSKPDARIEEEYDEFGFKAEAARRRIEAFYSEMSVDPEEALRWLAVNLADFLAKRGLAVTEL